MGRYFKFIICLVLICIFLIGCSKENEPFVIPVNYTADASVIAYTDKTENSYNVKITCKNDGYNFTIDDGSSYWNISYEGKVCTLLNDKFKENSVQIDNFKIGDSLLSEFNLNKFNTSLDPVPEELIYWDGTYKHVLDFSKDNLLPEKIFIYKNDNLVKAIHYNKINIEKEK